MQPVSGHVRLCVRCTGATRRVMSPRRRVLRGWTGERQQRQGIIRPCLYQHINLLLPAASCNSLLDFPSLSNARLLIMLRLSKLLHYTLFVALLLKATQSLFKRLVLLNSDLTHPSTTPLLQVGLCTPLALTPHSLKDFIPPAVMPACILGLNLGYCITSLNLLSRETLPNVITL